MIVSRLQKPENYLIFFRLQTRKKHPAGRSQHKEAIRQRQKRGDPRPCLFDHEEQQNRNEEGENAKTFGERRTDEGATELAVGSRRVTQSAGEEVAENGAHANSGNAHADSCETGANIFCGNGIHDVLL
jgi:hypothetical protein